MALTNAQGKLIVTNNNGQLINFPVTGNILATTGAVTTISAPLSIVTSNLVSYWKLEESSVSAGAILDTALSGFGTGASPANNGTASGTAPFISDGINGNSHTFSGDDYITVTNASSLNPAAFTFSAWVRCSSFNTGSNVIAAKNESTPIWWITIFSDGSVRSGNNAGSDEANSAAGIISLNVWYYITVTHTGTVKTVYVDGVQVATVNSGVTLPTNDTTDLLIGGRPTYLGSGHAMKGEIDEVSFYSTAQTSTQIYQNYSAYMYTGLVTRGLISYWKLEEASTAGSAILDSAYTSYGVGSNPGNHGTRFGTSPISDYGISGNCHSFSGDDYIVVNNEPNFAIEWSSPWSVSAWVNSTSAGTTKNIFAKQGGVNDKGWRLIHNSNQYEVQVIHSNGGHYTEGRSPAVIVANKWQHVTATWNGSGHASTGLKFYVDGLLVSTVNAADFGGGLTGGDTILNSLPPTIGARAESSHGELFSGLIDEVGFWNVELTAAEALQVYQSYFKSPIATSGLVSWYDLNGDYKDKALLKTGTGAIPANDGTNVGGTYTFSNIPGFFPGSITANTSTSNGVTATASNDYITLGNSSTLRPTTGITIEFRGSHDVWASKGGSEEEIIDIGSSSIGNQGVSIQNNGADGILFKVHNGGGTTDLSLGNGSWPYNEIAHWACTYDGSLMRIYKNGVMVGSTAKTGNLTYTFTYAILSGRVTGNSGGDGINGWSSGDRFDFFRIYNRALSDTEVKNNCLAGF